MIQILSWNIQNGEGVDGSISLNRIADTIFDMSTPDVICLQEVSRNCELKDGTQPDQVNQLSNLFKGYLPFFGPAYDVLRAGESQREQFGNIILSKLPVLSTFNHILPQLTNRSFRHMPRQVTEITVQTPLFPVCVMTTHLEYGSQDQRYEQVKRILAIKNDIDNLSQYPPIIQNSGPYAKLERPNRVIICGDFNFESNSKEYNLLTSNSQNQEALIDSWRYLNPNSEHAPTCGIFDKKQWSDGAHCRDFAFVSANLKNNIDNIFVNVETDASDHQPFILTLSNPNIL
tara:strand:+ start:86 stop:949 length:864 start_codon:yes stop_codon:yes gene_type:complete